MLWAACFVSHAHFLLFSTVCPAHWVLRAYFQQDLFQNDQYGFVITAILDFKDTDLVQITSDHSHEHSCLTMLRLQICTQMKVVQSDILTVSLLPLASHFFRPLELSSLQIVLHSSSSIAPPIKASSCF